MEKKHLFKTIVSDIQSDPFFSKYKFIRSENRFVLRGKEEFIYVELEHWRDYWDDACILRPYCGKHFNILAKWFEKYSVKPIKIQRSNPHIMVGQDIEIEIKYDFSDYNEKFPQLITLLKEQLSTTIKEYSTLNDYYNKIVYPTIMGVEKLPDCSADWIFEYLTAGYLLDRENYPALKKKVFKHAEWLLHHHELNVAEYYDRLDEIIAYMEADVRL